AGAAMPRRARRLPPPLATTRAGSEYAHYRSEPRRTLAGVRTVRFRDAVAPCAILSGDGSDPRLSSQRTRQHVAIEPFERRDAKHVGECRGDVDDPRELVVVTRAHAVSPEEQRHMGIF